ncbi:hypothetical protein ATCC90586_002753 [Pythium insidiosum]|nr:hypothetical protein ATCC90586_002753 [Pythium insidiosum]
MNLRLLLSMATLASGAAAVVDRSVHRALQEGNTVDVIVTMKTRQNVAESFQESAYPSRTQRIEALKAELEKTHGEALKPLANLVAKESTHADLEFKAFWITPVASLKAVTPELVAKLAELPGVESIREEKRIKIEKPIVEAAPEAVMGQEWGVKRIGAPRVWADGTTGQGIVVGAIDTGARATHEILKRSFVGKYGWFDPENKAAKPYDPDGHGTHVLGTIAGANGYGVAPAAKWMMCKACRTEDCPESDLLDCAQFMLCPTDTDGKNPDCSKAPRIVSNSWGGGQGDFWYKDAVNAWIKAGMVPVFAMGNDGDLGCKTAGSPGDYPNVIGVGSTTMTDKLSWFSSRGPTVNGRIKPDISAPGSKIKSAYNGSDVEYEYLSGTSMATPHVSGAIALLLSQNPDMALDEIKVALYTTTEQSGLWSNETCGGTSDAVWPNNQFGHGLLNIFHAYQGFRPAPTPRPTTLPTPTTAAPVPTTTAPAPQPKCTTSLNTDFYGEDLKRVEAKDAAACCDACVSTSGCKAFTFVDNAWDKSACYLKKAVGKQTKYDGAVSGTVN